MKNTNRFTNKAQDYAKYRPTYPQECINYLIKNMKIKNKIIADIGSGTGKFTELILDYIKKVYAVEPNRYMRRQAEKLLNKNKKFISINGSAENTNLKNNSLDIIISAQAFHWFDLNKTKIEFRRILKSNSKIILIWNSKINNTKYLKEQKQILNKYVLKENNRNKNIVNRFFSNNYKKISFNHYQEFNLEGVLGRIKSLSYCPLPNTKEYKNIEKKINIAFKKYSKNGLIKYNYRCNAYIGKI
jgi:ubiquinone/menaquinone biosynthesis C-methylase UbiE